MWCRTVFTGLSDPNGSWKMICTFERYPRMSLRRLTCATSPPSKRTAPEVGSYSRAIKRATVLLPLPLSPTSAVIVPGRSENETSSTA